MSAIKEAMGLIKDVFNDYAWMGGDKETLSKEELHALFRCEFKGGATTEKDVDDLLRKLDTDKDGVVTFKEFVDIVADVKLLQG